MVLKGTQDGDHALVLADAFACPDLYLEHHFPYSRIEIGFQNLQGKVIIFASLS